MAKDAYARLNWDRLPVLCYPGFVADRVYREFIMRTEHRAIEKSIEVFTINRAR